MSKWFIGLCLTLGLSPAMGQDVPIHWTDLNNVSHDPINQTITKNVPGGGWNAWARSLNVFDANERGHLKYTADVVPGGNVRLIVALGTFQTSYGIGSVEYGFRVRNNAIIDVIEGGSVVTSLSRTGGGEELELIRRQNGSGSWIVRYRMNGTNVYTASATPDEYYAYGLIRQNGQTIEGLRADLIVGIDRTHYSCENAVDGAIDLTISGGVPPYTILWSTGATTEDVTGLTPGVYTVDITDDVGNNVTDNIRILSDIFWTDEVGVVSTPNTLFDLPPFSAAGAASENTLAAGDNGWIRFETDGVPGIRAIGFSSTNADETFFTIEDGLLFFNNIYGTWESGSFTFLGIKSPGDVFRIRRNNAGNFRYFVNGALVATTPGNIADDLIIDASFFSTPAVGFTEVVATFCNLATPSEPTIPYPNLAKKLDGELYFLGSDHQLYFQYDEQYNSDGLTYKIYNQKHEVVYSNADQTLTPIYGDNRFQLNFNTTTGGFCLDSPINTLEVENLKGEKWYLRFRYSGFVCI